MRKRAETRARLAILSATGTARKRIIPAIAGDDSVELVGIHGRDEAKLAAIAQEFAIPGYFLDPEAMLTTVRPDFVYIASPPTLHAEHIQLCLENGIPALCEKPLCLSSSEARAICSLVDEGDVPVRVAHHLRHQAGVRAVRDLIQGGSLGPLRRASMQWGFWLNESSQNAKWKLDPALGGADAFYDVGVHVVDLLIHLLPLPTRVAAVAGRSRFESTIDNVSAVVTCGDAVVELNASWSTGFARNRLVLDFEEGSVAVDAVFGEAAFPKMEVVSRAGTSVTTFPTVNPYQEEIRDFAGLLRGGASPATTVAEACRGLEVIEAIGRSYGSGAAVDL